ncbi:MAG: diacylglycerol kinase family protein [Pontixanthobacter sp.]
MDGELFAISVYGRRAMSSHSIPQKRRSDPIVGVIYNPRSHRNRGQDLDVAARTNVFVEQPSGKAEIATALDRFSELGIDYLIINGGDGTVRDVLTQAQYVFGDDWPELAVLPKGKTNALNVDLGAPAEWTLTQAIDAWFGARRIHRHPVAVHAMEGNEAGPRLGFIMGGGAFTLGVRAGQDAHRMGAFDSFAVGVTTAWGAISILLGGNRNKWRRGTPMRFKLGSNGDTLPYRGAGDPARRSLFLASTLQRFPAGMQIFAKSDKKLRLMVLDEPKRRIFGIVPAILKGWVPRWARQAGFHQTGTNEFRIAIGDEYILDGEAYPAGEYRVTLGPELTFIVP